MSRNQRSDRRRFLKAILGGVLGVTGSAWLSEKSAAKECVRCGVPCAFCYGSCQVDRGHSGNHVCQNLHTWYGPRSVTSRPAPTCSAMKTSKSARTT